MEIATTIISFVTALLSLGSTVLVIVHKKKHKQNHSYSAVINIKAQNNSTVINNSPNATVTNNTVNIDNRKVQNYNSCKSSTSNSGVEMIFVIFVLGLVVAVLYTMFKPFIYFTVILEYFVLSIVFSIQLWKCSMRKREIILTILGIIQGIAAIPLFRPIFWSKFVGGNFKARTKFNGVTDGIEYFFANKSYLYFTLLELVITFLVALIALILINYSIRTLRKKTNGYGDKIDYIVMLLPTLSFLFFSFYLYINPVVFSGLK